MPFKKAENLRSLHFLRGKKKKKKKKNSILAPVKTQMGGEDSSFVYHKNGISI